MVRAQAFTLEAVTASLLLVAAVVFALGATALTPLSASTASQHVENQQGALAAGTLDAAEANGTLAPTVLYWNDSGGRFHGASAEGYYPNSGPPTAFGARLNRTFADRSIAFNVNVLYVSGGEVRREPLVRLGTPSDNAVTATRRVTLTDDDVLRAPGGEPTDVPLSNASTFYAPDAAPSSPLYNVVRVEVVVWRM